MKITLTAYAGPPSGAGIRSQEYPDMISFADTTLFVWSELERLTKKKLKKGEIRSIEIGVKIEE